MSRRSPPTLVFRCPECGDQTKQCGPGAECGLCRIVGRRSLLVACTRELRVVNQPPGAIETATSHRMDGGAAFSDRAQKSRM